MGLKANVVKGIITSIAGGILIFSALFLWFFGLIEMVPEALVAIVLGVILLFSPKALEKKVSELIKAWGGKSNFGGGGDIDIDINRKHEDSGNQKTGTE